MKPTRRKFLATSAALGLASVGLPGCLSSSPESKTSAPSTPWYRRTFRWGQTNITEADPPTYDIEWWRGYWKQTRVQGIIVNAGGIVAYYPSKELLQYRAADLGNRDLFGELVKAAHTDSLAVLARMDSNRAHENFYQAHPDWFAVDSTGRPRKAGDLYVACVNSPYYDEYLPGILREIAQRYHPEGFTDNSWSGLGRQDICYCENCRDRFRSASGKALPKRKDWDDAAYREWILWNYERRLELWEHNNHITQDAGGPDCLWVGMNSGSVVAQCQSFRDYRGICRRAKFLLLDHQARGENGGLAENADVGQLVHSLLGWNKLVPESMAMYQAGGPTFRKTSKPELEARLWMLEGIAGGIQPWWHHVGATQEDRRQFQIAGPIYRWHEANQEFLTNREPIASVGLVWSQKNTDFFGRDQARELVELPWRGWTQALLGARIPYLPVHVDDLEAAAQQMAVLILPNVGAVSDAHVAGLRHFVEGGGSLISTGRTSLFDESGQLRSDFALADLVGCHYVTLGREGERPRESAGETLHTYLRIEPGSSASNDGRSRHPILTGFDQTDILPFGGWLGDVMAAEGTLVPLTYVPAFPIYPPETAWMREPRTKIPGLIINHALPRGRVAFLTADLDRRFAKDNLPDHGRLLANLVRWAARERLPIHVEGHGLIDCRLYRQGARVILHLVNLTNTGAWRAPVDELVPIGPIAVRVRLPFALRQNKVRLLVSQNEASWSFGHGELSLKLRTLVDHQVVVIG